MRSRTTRTWSPRAPHRRQADSASQPPAAPGTAPDAKRGFEVRSRRAPFANRPLNALRRLVGMRPVTSARASPSGRPVRDLDLGRAVDLLRCQEHDGAGADEPARRDRETDRGRCDIVGHLRDDVHVVLAEREVERLELATSPADRLLDGPAPRGAPALEEPSNPVRRVRRDDQVPRHRPLPTSSAGSVAPRTVGDKGCPWTVNHPGLVAPPGTAPETRHGPDRA